MPFYRVQFFLCQPNITENLKDNSKKSVIFGSCGYEGNMDVCDNMFSLNYYTKYTMISKKGLQSQPIK